MTVVRVDAESLRQYALRARMVSHDLMGDAAPEVALNGQATTAAVATLHGSVAVGRGEMGCVAMMLAVDTESAAALYTSTDEDNADLLRGVL